MNPLLRRVVLASTLLGPVLGAPPALAAAPNRTSPASTIVRLRAGALVRRVKLVRIL